MENFVPILLLSALVVAAIVPFKGGRLLFKWAIKISLYILISPYYLWRLAGETRSAQRRRRSYELLGRYIGLFGNNSDIIKYFRNLIESGIGEDELQVLLDANLAQSQNYPAAHREEMSNKLQHEQELKRMAAEQHQILLQSKLSLEQIKFREQLLDQLYQKIRKKYRI